MEAVFSTIAGVVIGVIIGRIIGYNARLREEASESRSRLERAREPLTK